MILPDAKQGQAYRIAFPDAKCNKKSLYERASRLMSQPKIKARIAELMAPVVAETRLTAERWQLELDRLALGDVRKLFDTHGNPLDIPALGDDEAPCIAGFEIVEEFSGTGKDRVPVGYTRKFKLVDKLRALELAGKTRGYYVEKKKIDGVFTLEQLVDALEKTDDKP